MTGKREALIDAAKTLLWERGFEAMSPKAVLKESGAGQGSLYHHFEGKRDLAATALIEVDAQAREKYAKVFSDDVPPLKRIISYIEYPRDALMGCKFGRLSNEKAIADPVLNPIVSGYFKFIEQQLRNAIRDAQKAGDLSSDVKPKELAQLINATIQGGYVLSRIHQDPAPMKNTTRAMKKMINGLTLTQS